MYMYIYISIYLYMWDITHRNYIVFEMRAKLNINIELIKL